jgi:hypothetical protein
LLLLTTNPQAQCLKCADLVIFAGNNFNAALTTASQLRGSTTSNIYTVCDDTDPKPAFNVLVSKTDVETAFDTCLVSATVNPGTSSFLQS